MVNEFVGLMRISDSETVRMVKKGWMMMTGTMVNGGIMMA